MCEIFFKGSGLTASSCIKTDWSVNITL